MNNTFGRILTVTLFGESHGTLTGAVIDGMPAGIRIDRERIAEEMDRRRAQGMISTPRREADVCEIVSGVYNGYSQGTPLTILIRNTNAVHAEYDREHVIPRPSHGDYSSYVKYSGYSDRRGGGHLSGRLTAPLCAAGAICRMMLEEKGIFIGTHIRQLYDLVDREFADDVKSDIDTLNAMKFAVLDPEVSSEMLDRITQAKAENDSLGGILETCIYGLEAGLGEPWFDSMESLLAHAAFSIPGIKGIEFGNGFGLAGMKGSEANDSFALRNGKVITLTNRSGGINGGITNGMPVVFRTAVRPTPTIAQPQKSVDLTAMKECTLTVSGRHDPAFIHRARAVQDCMSAFVIADLLLQRYGTEYFQGERR
ncbi:MAG: chorismate synthase [Solobacterium sp.]|nr:chorismate synthase [Solobacterium sp.]